MPAGDAERWIILLRAHGRKRRQPHLTSWHRHPVLQMPPDESTLLEKATEKNLLSEVWCTYRPLGKVSLCNVMHQEFKQRSFWVLCSNEGRIRECISDIKLKKKDSHNKPYFITRQSNETFSFSTLSPSPVSHLPPDCSSHTCLGVWLARMCRTG